MAIDETRTQSPRHVARAALGLLSVAHWTDL